MNKLLEHLLMWCPFVGLILFLSKESWADRYLFGKGKELRGFLCIMLWQGAWYQGGIVTIGFWLASLF